MQKELFAKIQPGDVVEGTVKNVTDFGAFIDIGIKNDGLVHISKITDRYIKHPSEVLSVGDIVTCYVDEVFLDKGKVALSLIKNEKVADGHWVGSRFIPND